MEKSRSATRIRAGCLLMLLAVAAPSAAQQSKIMPEDEVASIGATRKSGYVSKMQFGGPDSVAGELVEADEIRKPAFRLEAVDNLLKPWFDWKARLNEDYGLMLGLNYTFIYQKASESIGEDEAGGGIFQTLTKWTPFGRGTSHPGTLVFKLENRQRVGTNVSPGSLGSEIGSLTPTTFGFSNFQWGVIQLNWEQKWLNGRVGLVVGRVQPIAYLDTYALASPFTGFTNQSFSYSPTIAIPASGLGVAGGAMLTDNIYCLGSLSDANGSNTYAGFDTFFDDNEYFKHLEVGWVPSFERRKQDNIHLTAWHVDKRDDAGKPEGWGLNLSATRFINETWLPFLRAGWSHGDAAALEAMVSAGVGYHLREKSDVIGLGLSWGKPAESALDDQVTGELFYRLRLARNLAVTPNFQLIGNPANNPDEDLIALFGLRLRLTF